MTSSEVIRREGGQGAIDVDYIAYLKSGFPDSSSKIGEPGFELADTAHLFEQADPEYQLFLASTKMIDGILHVQANEQNNLLENYQVEVISDGELDQYMQQEKVSLVDDNPPLSRKMGCSQYEQRVKRKTEIGTGSCNADPIEPNHSEDERHYTTENISDRQGGNTEKCSPMPSEVFQLAKRVKFEVDSVDTDLMWYLESKGVVRADGHVNIDASHPENIRRPKPRFPEHIESCKRSHTHMQRSKPNVGSSKIKSPEHIPSFKRESPAYTQRSKIRPPEYSGSSKMKSPAHTGSLKPEPSRHSQRSEPCLKRSSSNSEHPAHKRTSNIKTEDNVCLGGWSAGNSKFATQFGAAKSKADDDEDLVCLDIPSAKTSSPFREELLRVLSKPFDSQELRMLEIWAKSSKKVDKLVDLRGGREKLVATDKDGKALIDHYYDLRRKLESNGSRERERLNLLRGFEFWIQHLTQDGAFQPWKDQICKNLLPPYA